MMFMIILAVLTAPFAFQSTAIADSGVLIQFKMGPFVPCGTLATHDERRLRVKNFMQQSLIEGVNALCHPVCSFTSSHILSPILLFDTPQTNYPTFRATIIATNNSIYPSTAFVSTVQTWVGRDSPVTDGLGYYTVDSSCPVYVQPGGPPCGAARTEGYSNAILIGALVSEFVGLTVTFCIIMAVVLSFYSNRMKKTNIALKKQRMRKRLNSSISHQSHDSCLSDARVADTRVANLKMQSCQAYATSI